MDRFSKYNQTQINMSNYVDAKWILLFIKSLFDPDYNEQSRHNLLILWSFREKKKN